MPGQGWVIDVQCLMDINIGSSNPASARTSLGDIPDSISKLCAAWCNDQLVTDLPVFWSTGMLLLRGMSGTKRKDPIFKSGDYNHVLLLCSCISSGVSGKKIRLKLTGN
jgi:hypothetical protein